MRVRVRGGRHGVHVPAPATTALLRGLLRHIGGRCRIFTRQLIELHLAGVDLLGSSVHFAA